MSYFVTERVYKDSLTITNEIVRNVYDGCDDIADAMLSAIKRYENRLHILEKAGVVYLEGSKWSHTPEMVYNLGSGRVVCYPEDYDIWYGDFEFCIEWVYGCNVEREIVSIHVVMSPE